MAEKDSQIKKKISKMSLEIKIVLVWICILLVLAFGGNFLQDNCIVQNKCPNITQCDIRGITEKCRVFYEPTYIAWFPYIAMNCLEPKAPDSIDSLPGWCLTHGPTNPSFIFVGIIAELALVLLISFVIAWAYRKTIKKK